MSDPDSLVATRARRANAGSRLKQLIEIEEQATGVSNIVYSEDDENVQLLFQEDENDEEFENSDENESDESQGDEELDEGEAQTMADNEDEDSKTVEEELAVNSDEMLSDSDLSASENDDSEGERELQKVERDKKRKKKPNSIIPAIKKPKLATDKPQPKAKTKHSELLLNIDRRASSRKSAMKNKEVLVQKLKEDEKRRAALTPVVRVDERQLTQEERLAQAVETEKKNVLSLHSFLEQEVVKKEHQKLLFQLRRVKLRNVVRLFSTETYIAPIDEIEDARHVQDLFSGKKKGRRKRNAPNVPEEARPGDIDTELPYYKKEMEEKRIREEKEAAEKEKLELEQRELEAEEKEAKEKESEEKESEEVVILELVSKELHGEADVTESTSDTNGSIAQDTENVSDGPSAELHSPPIGSSEDLSHPVCVLETVTENDIDIEVKREIVEGGINEEASRLGTEKDELDASQHDSERESSLAPETHASEETNQDGSNDVDKDSHDSLEDNDNISRPEIEKGRETETDLDDGNVSTNQEGAPPKDQTPLEEKKVTFADIDGEEMKVDEETKLDEEMIIEEDEEREPDSDIKMSYRASKDGSVFEGPEQYVGRNHVILMNFDEEQYPYLSETKVKTILFGSATTVGASRKFKDGKTILKSSIRLDNPYAAVKDPEENDLLKPVTGITEDDPMFEALKRLPRLGVKETLEVEEENVQKEETTEIQIRTEAPSGLYLPNGNKKLCLISGKEVRYFDPATGIPYENKDVYKVIKTIEQGVIPWFSIGKDQNSYGDIQVYLNHRNGARHAKGVPEGFDGF